ncbi:MAG: hypothetical protein HY722_17305 [Planctomycetes bacterium]|nr:hypothetical protein [Planctomycetota bacterium]
MIGMSCKRCGRDEYIPTHQFVKFDSEVNYVCEECWAEFRRWFNQGERARLGTVA